MADRILYLVFVFLLFQSTFAQLNSSAERAALFSLRSSLGLRSKEWPRNADPCTWVGIRCSELGRVVSINLFRLKRTRLARLNPSFSVGSLTKFSLLSSFVASGFLLPGPIPDLFGQLDALQVLDLRSCSINGTVPLFFGNLTSLYKLDLSRNLLRGVIPSSNFLPQNLSLLDLSSNVLTGSIPSSLGGLSHVQILNISNNSLSGSIPVQFGNLSQLIELDLSLNSLAGALPSELQTLRNLKKMVLNGNLLSGSLQDSLFSDAIRLQFIDLSQNNLSGELPESLWNLPNLVFLDVSYNNFTGTISNVSSNSSLRVGVFRLSHNQFYGALNPQLGRMGLVELSDNYFQGSVPDDVSQNISLTNNCLQNFSSQRTLEDCTLFYATKGLSFNNFGVPNTTQPPTKKSNKRLIFTLVGVFGGLGFIVLLVLVLILCLRIYKSGVSDQRGSGRIAAGGSIAPAGMSVNISNVGEAYKYELLLHAAGEFSDLNLIKHGHSGDLFRGVLEGGVSVVVKKIDIHSFENESYMVELDLFSKASHTRLVPLLGHCLEHENEKLLVYKYMPNGDLSNSLFRKSKQEGDNSQSLDWITRLKIAIGAAEALTYLHHECNPPLVHRDVQASSILLDDKFEVRLGSLSEVRTQEGENQQNVISRLLRIPETSQQGTSGLISTTCSYDVYCFGKVLLELITGKLGISSTSSDAAMNEWLENTLPYISIYEKDLVTTIIDPSLIIDEDLLEEVWAMAVVAKSCLNPKPSKRPLMRYILKALENPSKVVRDENYGSARLRTTSSRGSWSAALFGSWRSSSEISANRDGAFILKQSAMAGSQRSWRGGGIMDLPLSNRRLSSDAVPEAIEVPDIERSQEED